jgi:hypothetical protein
VLNRDQEAVDWEMRSLISGETFGYVCAYGTPPLAEQFQLLCPEEWTKMIAQVKDNSTDVTRKPSVNSESETLSYVGNWYVSNSSVCKDKPGESAELITYTPGHTMGPEISCKILRATPRGAATELDLLCNGEGERGFRQKEMVQVVNGHLEVSYVANGRKSTDKYLRCP